MSSATRTAPMPSKPQRSLATVDLSVRLGPLRLKNPVLVASGTFGYGLEFTRVFDIRKLGGIIGKSLTRKPRLGNPPPRAVEVPGGMLNNIGLENKGMDYFLAETLPEVRRYKVPFIANIAGTDLDEYVWLAKRLEQGAAGRGVDAIELNVSCPNVREGGIHFGVSPEATAKLLRAVRRVTGLPLITKLTPNCSDIPGVARAAVKAGSDMLSAVNTFPAMVIDWRRRKPFLGGVTGGLSGPVLKCIALRILWIACRSVDVPVIGIGGISTADDAMDYLVTGARAIQVGTANFVDPSAALRVVEGLPERVRSAGARRIRDLIGTLQGEAPMC